MHSSVRSTTLPDNPITGQGRQGRRARGESVHELSAGVQAASSGSSAGFRAAVRQWPPGRNPKPNRGRKRRTRIGRHDTGPATLGRARNGLRAGHTDCVATRSHLLAAE